MIYLFIFILLLFFIYLYDYKRESRGYRLSFYILLVIFIAVAGLRYRIGGDTPTYMKFFENIHPLGSLSDTDFSKSRFAPGFVLLTSTVKTFSADFVFFQFIHAIIVNCVVFMFIKKHCEHIFFCILLFFSYLYVFLLFEQVRESFAVAIFLLAWPAFKKGIWWQWYLAALLAFMFHVSAFIMFLLPLICLPGIRELFKFGKRTWYICLFVFIIGIVVQTTLFRYVEMIALTESMIDRVQAYENVKRSDVLNINRILGMLIQYIAYPLLALHFIYKRKENGDMVSSKEKNIGKETMMTLMSVYISILTIFIGILIRYNNYFFLFAAIMMGDWIFTNLYTVRKYVRMGFVYWMLVFLPMFSINFYFTYLTPVNKAGTLYNYMRYYPYSSVIDQTVDDQRERTITYIRRKN